MIQVQEAIDVVLGEARLLDAGRFEEWLDLYADDGRYWVPLGGAAQADATSTQSIALEDKLMLKIRVSRLRDPRAHSQHPPSQCQHVLQAPQWVSADPAADACVTATPFFYAEAQGERRFWLAGTYRHTLARRGQVLKIVEKRVDLLGPGQALPAIQLFI
ncbi:MAG: nuclear transport factor 2 family protein [Burkholderiales bacterium]|nr:nuclear transport factor 2 family protein [Burkholderiales bacterium]